MSIKKIKKIYYSFLSFSLFCPTFLLASSGDGDSSNLFGNPLQSTSLNGFFKGIIDVALQLGTIVAALSIMYGGFMYVTAQGDEEKIGKATKTMTWALVGTAVLLGARVIMAAIQGTINSLN